MQDHELRQRAVAEMHLRRWPVLPVPCLVVQWVYTVEAAEREGELAAVEGRAELLDPVENPAHRSGRLSGAVRFAWERHSEGSSLALFVRGDAEGNLPGTARDPDGAAEIEAALGWATGALPGRVVRSTWILVVEDDADAEALVAELGLKRDELVSGRIGGTVRFWSDFRLKPDGFGRLVVAANGADRRDLTRQLQRLQELGNYRNRALLGLPVARDCWPKLDAAEQRLRLLSDRVANAGERDDELMEALSALSLELVSISTTISFRMDATRAYAELVEERLRQLDAEPIPGFISLGDFTQRRFRPAMSTCAATTERVARLALRAEQLSSLLRARIDTRIENQNAALLASMERSTTMQLRLQQLVEGLSVVALSYYLLSLVALALKAAPAQALPAPTEQLVGWAALPLVLLVWLTLRILKNRILGR